MSQNYDREYSAETDEAFASHPLPFETSQPRGAVRPPPLPPSAFQSSVNPYHIAGRGLSQALGLVPTGALMVVSGDVMLHSADVISAGLLIPLSILSGGVLGYITYKLQLKYYGDDVEAAMIKALIVAFLTAIPSPLPYMLFIPAGVVGFFKRRS